VIDKEGNNKEIEVTEEMCDVLNAVLFDEAIIPWNENNPPEISLYNVIYRVLESSGLSVQNPPDKWKDD